MNSINNGWIAKNQQKHLLFIVIPRDRPKMRENGGREEQNTTTTTTTTASGHTKHKKTIHTCIHIFMCYSSQIVKLF